MNREQTCEATRARLSGLLDGDLPEAERERAEAHVAACTGCAAELDALRGLVRDLSALPTEMEPDEDLWPELAARLPRRARRGSSAAVTGRVWLALAASFVIVASLAIAWRRSAIEPGGADPGWVAQLEAHAEYERAAGQLMKALDARRSELSPETVAEIERNLSLIDEALGRTRQALAADPASGPVAEMHVALHEQKLSLLQSAALLPADRSVQPASPR